MFILSIPRNAAIGRAALDEEDVSRVRYYLANSTCDRGFDVLCDAITRREPGARALVQLTLAMRVNRRCGQSWDDVTRSYAVVRVIGATGRRTWLMELAQTVYSVHRAWRLNSLPMAERVTQVPGVLSRQQCRSLHPTGLVGQVRCRSRMRPLRGNRPCSPRLTLLSALCGWTTSIGSGSGRSQVATCHWTFPSWACWCATRMSPARPTPCARTHSPPI